MSFPIFSLPRLILGAVLWIALHDPVLAQEPTPQGPLETLSATRDRIVLNGLWKFLPAVGPSSDAPAGDWGLAWVPGSWIGVRLPGIVRTGSSPEWKGDVGPSLEKAWYERQIDVPSSWQGWRIVLDFGRVSVDASVWVNGVECGEVPWPFGRVDITRAVTPGKTADVRVLVKAPAPGGEHEVAMGPNPNQNYKVKNALSAAGLIGEVFLVSEPLGAEVTDVFMKPSYRGKKIALDVEVTGLTKDETAAFTATMTNGAGQDEQVFHVSVPLRALPVQRVELTFPWANPQLWSPDHPNLYTLHLKVAGADIQDTYPQRFGFREFWIEGEKFFLNGQEIRLRPTVLGGGPQPGTQAGIDGYMDGVRAAGFNIVEQWPFNHDVKGAPTANLEFWCDRADEKGMLIIGAALNFRDYLYDSPRITWFDPGYKEHYKERLDAEMRRYRNHPSVVMWATTPNIYGRLQDENPLAIGVRESGLPLPPYGLQDPGNRAGLDALNVIRSVDPTRPVFCHAGDMVGDVYTVNTYLNFMPLQEREEWLSNYISKGDMPYMAIEFGQPFAASLLRGRNGYTRTRLSEPLATEFCATYLGPEAYRLESSDYRTAIRTQFVSGLAWTSWQHTDALNEAPAFQEVQSLFIRNTWRSWRAAGNTGGMVPWAINNQVWVEPVGEISTPPNPPFQPGQRGAYGDHENGPWLPYLDPAGGWKVLPAGQTFMDVNGPTLAWIAGAPENFYEKAHSFRIGQTVSKQICLINDLPSEAPYHVTWRIVLAGKTLHEETDDGKIAVATNLFLPISFSVPGAIDGEKAQGEIDMDATIGGRASSDRFPFVVFNPSPTPLPKFFLFDPAGKTGELFQKLGADTAPWKGEAASSERPLLVVGRQALSGRTPLPGDLNKFVSNGGRLVVMGQDPDWMRNTPGFRMCREVGRRFFPVMSDQPITTGLDGGDLRDWAGAGTLIEARPAYPLNAKSDYGWHWGNQGSVSSSAVEKPHLSGWTPILEGEFDLQYSPLMQLQYGKGLVMLCTLDLEDQASVDPVAEILARRILQQAVTEKSEPRRKTVYLGGDADAMLLQGLGLTFERGSSLPGPDALAVIGPDAPVTAAELNRFAARGGNILVLAGQAGQNLLGDRIENRDSFTGTTEFQSSAASPLAGLSVSDLHFRTDITWPVLVQGGTLAANGLISWQSIGSGTVVAAQLDPTRLDADKLTYLRFTRWRQTRALTQLLANLGASFAADRNLFHADAKSPFYHSDYRTDLDNGDEPCRYYRW